MGSALLTKWQSHNLSGRWGIAVSGRSLVNRRPCSLRSPCQTRFSQQYFAAGSREDRRRFQNLGTKRPPGLSLEDSKHQQPSTGPRIGHRGQQGCRMCALKTGSETTSGTAEVTRKGSLWDWKGSINVQIAYAALLSLTPLVPLLPRFEYSGQLYMLLTACLTVYIGSHRSLAGQMPSKMTMQNSLVVPFACSASLFGFYCILRFFPDLDLKAFLSAYLAFIGALAVGSNLAEPFAAWGGPLAKWQTRIDLPQWVKEEGQPVHMDVRGTDIVAGLVGILASIVNSQPDAPYTLNNFIAVCLVTELLQLLSLGSFTTAAVMLVGLLAYDVFWVFESAKFFGDNVMVTVATSSAFSGPLKLTFPAWTVTPEASAAQPYQILGLGDITAPGLLIALMLRFDRFRSSSEPGESESLSKGLWGNLEDKTYFRTCLGAYALGLMVTIGVNKATGDPQPALLYLVPSVLAGVGLAALAREEGSLLLDYRDAGEPIPVPIEVEDEES